MRQRSAEGPSVDLATGIAEGPARTLSQVHAFYKESEGLLDIVAVGGINGGRDAYIAHLTGAKGLQVGSALIKEGAGALERIDRELDELLAANGKASVARYWPARLQQMRLRSALPNRVARRWLEARHRFRLSDLSVEYAHRPLAQLLGRLLPSVARDSGLFASFASPSSSSA